MTVGRTISHFQIVARIGEGGMGVVYEARDVRLDRSVALKFLPSHLGRDLLARGRFVQEAKAASALDHPNICTIYEIGESDEGEVFIAMALYRGQTLKALMEGGALPPARAIDLACQIASGLAAAHDANIVHRDIKPANVMVAEDGLIHILDFGLAKVAEMHLTATGATVGTVAYMSPEQARAEPVDRSTDLWSLGCVLYEMLAGISPFHAGHESAIVYRLLNEEPEPLGDRIPPEYAALGPVVTACLEKDRQLRYGSAADLREDLLSIERGTALAVAPVFRSRRFKGAPRRAGAAVLSLVAVAILVVLAVAFINRVPPLPAGIAVLPFRAVDMDPVDCTGLGELLTAPLVATSLQAGLTVVRQGELEQKGITTASEAYRVLGTELAFSGLCFKGPGRIELELTIEDAASGNRVIRQKHVSVPQSDLRELQLTAPAVIAELIPGLGRADADAAVGATEVPAAIAHYVRGKARLAREDLEPSVEQAIAELEQALLLDPDYGLARFALGDAYLIKHRFHSGDPIWLASAIDNLSRALSVAPSLIDARLALARAFVGQGALDKAQLEIERALAQDSSNWNVYRTRADLFTSRGDLDAAEASFRKAIARMPDRLLLRLQFGSSLVNRGRWAEARHEFEEILRRVPDSYLGLNAMGAVLYYQDSLARAADYFDRSLRQKPTYPALSNLASIQWDLGRFEDAAPRYRQLVSEFEAARRDHRLWGNLGLAEKASGRPDSARSAFEVAIDLVEDELAIQPENYAAQMDLAGYLAHTGSMDRALELARKSLQSFSEDGSSLQSAAVIYELAGDRDRALHWIGRAIASGHRISLINSDPDLDALREDPRYAVLFPAEEPAGPGNSAAPD